MLLLWAPLSHAQSPARPQTPTPAPPSSSAFAPAPAPAPPAPATAPAAPAPADSGSAAPTPTQPAPVVPPPPAEGSPASPSPEVAPSPPPEPPRPARVIAAPSSERPDSAALDELPADDEDEMHKRGFHVHDGFYLRLGLGVGYVAATSENDSTFKGWGIAPDIWIGGSPTPGLAIGVTLNGVSVPDPHLDATAADTGGLGPVSGEAPGTLTYSVFGLFADYYPDPTAGLHFMAGLNYSVMQFKADSGVESDPASGVGLMGGMGYEWWIGRDWSVGPVARLHWASVSDVGGRTSVLSPVFLLGFTYH